MEIYVSLIAEEVRHKLLKNGLISQADHVPILKLFTCTSVFLASKIDPDDHDSIYGLWDNGTGFPFIDDFPISEFEQIEPWETRENTFRHDPDFKGIFSLEIYLKTAVKHKRIIEDPDILTNEYNRLQRSRKIRQFLGFSF